MRKVVHSFIILLLISAYVHAATVVDTETLTLVIPGDTLTVGFATDSKGTAFTEDTRVLSLNKSIFDETSSINTKTSNDDAGYATAAVVFYVYWDAFVSQASTVQLEVPSSFKSTTTDDTLQLVTDSTKIKNSSSATIIGTEDTKGTFDVVSFGENDMKSGSAAYIIAVDVSKAKPNLIYRGTLKLKVVAP